MTTFTSTLPEDLFKKLSNVSKELQMPKNRILEKALTLYLEQLDKLAYQKSYEKMAKDQEMLSLSEEGIEDYLKQLEDL